MQGSYVHTCFCSRNDHGTSWYVPCWEVVGCWNQHVPQPSQIAVTENIHFILPCSFPTPLGTAQHWTLWKRYKQNSVMDLWSSKQEQNLKSRWLILNVFDKIQSVQDSARFKGTTSYHIDLLGARNGIICMINHNHWKRSGRSITYSLFICMPEPGIWAQPNDWVVYFGSWTGLPKHAVAVHSVHMKIFAWLQVPRKLHLKYLNSLFHELQGQITFMWWQSMTKPRTVRTSGSHGWQVHPQKIMGWIFGPSTICTLLPSSEVHPQISMVTIPECQRRAMSQRSWWAYTRSWLPRNIQYMPIRQATNTIL